MRKIRKKLYPRKKGINIREAHALARMIALRKGSKKRRNAIIDTLSNKEVKKIGQIFKKSLKRVRKLRKSKIKELMRKRKGLNAIILNKGSLTLRKKILKQKGGFGLIAPLMNPFVSAVSKVSKFKRKINNLRRRFNL